MSNSNRVRSYGNFINGEWQDNPNEQFIERKDPATGRIVARFINSTEENVIQAVSAARHAFDHGIWPKMSGLERAQILYKLAQLMKENRDLLVRIEVEEVGKIIRIAQGDIDGAINLVTYAAGLAMQLHGETYTNLGQKLSAMVIREPVGVVGLIVPWNFPALIFCQKMPIALAAGCSVVVKPSEFTSGTCLEISRLAKEAGVPDGVINVVTGYGNPVGQALVDHPDIDRISFTGSTTTGRKVLVGSAGNFKRVSLELGGKSANIVFPDADLEDAIDGTLFGIFMNQGECCCSGTRLLIQNSIADQFLENLVDKARKLKVGNPMNSDTDVSALIHEQHLDKVLHFINLGKQEGATLLTGGERLVNSEYKNGNFVTPTIFDHVTPDMTIFKEEIFGPVLSVTRFNTVEEAIDIANNTQYGLTNAVWTKDIDKAMVVSRSLKSGTVWINTMIDGSPQLPFGGYKASGIGREMGNVGLDEFTEVKTIQIHTGKRNAFFNV